ncbi:MULTISPECIES: hypothetical protein [Enterobacteriaceae]|nr:hypothetical protein [Escherichia coli]MDD8313738.1 hypothetical protein [Escherichia coli]MDD8446414.1 hypothetical protein [Escherichia coli]
MITAAIVGWWRNRK